MLRGIALLIFAGLVAALFFTPAPSASSLAVAEVGKLLVEETVGDAPAVLADGAPIPNDSALADLVGPDGLAGTPLETILRSRAVELREPLQEGGRERLLLRLGGARFEGPGQWDMLFPGKARDSALRQIRSSCEEAGLDLEVEGLKSPEADGVRFLFRLDPEKDALTAEVGVGTSTEVVRSARTWRPIDQRSLLPPLIAIFLAILLRRPVAALFAGLWSGAILVRWLDGEGFGGATLQGLIGAENSARGFITEQLYDKAQLQIVLFVVFMLAMVGVITRAGGIRGVMERLSALARDARRTQVTTWLMGLVVFFDDYANTILVGSTMRPLTDRFKVAREKLAYIVDSTAAPVAGISILSTWIAFEVSTFSPSLPDAELASTQGYAVFLQTLPYRFYCILTLCFVGMVVLSGRDFGPMLTAERRARRGLVLREGATPMVGEAATRLEAADGVKISATTAIVPLVLFVGTVLGLILKNGGGFDMGARLFTLEGATQVLYNGSGNEPLMWGAIVGFAAALFLGVGRAGLRIDLALKAALDSLLSMGVALVILYLAWSLGAVCSSLGTATFLSVSLGDTLPWMILPIVLFLMAGLIAFSTGSSWSTMTILLPLVVGLAYRLGFDSADAALGMDAQRAAGQMLVVISIGAVLEGAIFGDHCSPISDTTVMSSIASASDHVDHVRTQAPYALTTMVVAMLVGYFPATFFGVSPWICLVAGIAALALVLRIYGKKADEPGLQPAG